LKVDVSTGEKPYQRTLEVEVPWDEIEPDYQTALQEFRKEIKMPGFRPGKVPLKVIKRQFGQQIEAQFASDMIEKYYRQALEEADASPVDRGAIEELDFAEGEPLVFKARYDVEPEMAIFPYQEGFTIEHTLYESTPADVDQSIEDLREQYAETKEKEGGAEDGDLMVIDLQRVDENGTPLIGQKVEDRQIKVGDGLFSGENLERLKGATPGDTRQIEVQPREPDSELEYYAVHVKKVEAQALPEPDDEFAQKVSQNAETYDELREEIQQNLQKRLDRESDSELSHRIAHEFVSHCDTELPESMIDNYLDLLMEDVKRQRASQTGNPPDIDEAVFKENYRGDAVFNLKWQLIKKQIIQEENLEADEAALDAKIDEIAEDYPEENREAIKNLYKSQQYRERLKDDLLNEKVLEHIKSFADIKETKKTTTEVRQEAEAREVAEAAVNPQKSPVQEEIK